MLPGITERQAGYARDVGAALGERRRRAWSPSPRATAPTSSAWCASSSAQGVDGVLVVMLTYGPGMRVARALSRDAAAGLPGQHPARARRSPPAWDMADLTYNQGVHGAQDTANAMVRAGVRVPRDHRRLAGRRASATRSSAGRARRAAITAWRSLRVAIFGYAMTRWATSAWTRARCCARSARRSSTSPPATCGAASQAVEREAIEAELAEEDERFEIDPRAQRRGARGPHPDAGRARAHPARARLPGVLDALRRDRRGRALRAAAHGRRLDA